MDLVLLDEWLNDAPGSRLDTLGRVVRGPVANVAAIFMVLATFFGRLRARREERRKKWVREILDDYLTQRPSST